ncbi:MAG: zinc-binding dehydrogenase [Rhodospirillales bacterium]|jgi:NADPH2:quinone reductase|nr:zinc-binding dehydrogenase [Rhodospirillales bacterium]MDP6645011.1 zinc-binding dehydrogenase [Rhodospirillales bacterium]
MKSVIFREAGGPEVLELVEAPEPVAGPGQIVIRTRAMGVSVPDLLIRKGVYKWSPPLPANPGNELAGTVVTVGEGVSEFGPGQPVLLSARELPQRGGCYTELIAVPVSAVHALSEGVDFERAVVLPTYVVAHAMLLGFGISKNARSIFVTGAAGAIATALTDLAKAEGISVIGSVSTEAKAAYARARGVDDVVYYKSEALLDRVMELTDGRGVDASFDHVIGSVFLDCVRMLADFGTAVAYNVFSPLPDKDVFDELRTQSAHSPAVRVFNIHTYDHYQDALRGITRELVQMLDAGIIDPSVGARLPLSEAAEAHRLLESGEVLGKIVLTA